MSNLFGIGLSGLNAARNAIATSSNNVSNVNTPGYTRQKIELDEARSSNGQGSGVQVSGVKRQYAQFISGQLNAAQSKSSALDTHLGQVSQINNLLGDSSAGLAPRLQDFFDSIQALAGDPGSAAARQSLLGDAGDLAGQFRAFSGFLGDQAQSVNDQLGGNVKQINNYAEQINSLNKQIDLTQSRTGQPPNNLLDKRDQLVFDLGKVVNADVSVQDGKSYNISVAGQPLVDGGGVHQLKVVADKADPGRKVVAYESGTGAIRDLDPDRLTGGSLGGLIRFRQDSLEPAELRLDQLAHTLAAGVNKVQEGGVDKNGEGGKPFFTVSTPEVIANADNSSNVKVASAGFTAGESAKIAAGDYQIKYSDSNYAVTRLGDGSSLDDVDISGNTLKFGGVEITLDGTPNNGDSFNVKPLAGAASNFDVAVKSPDGIAAGNSGKPGDNRNALALADLQNADTVDGNKSFNDAYAQLVSDIGNKTQTLQTNSDAQQSLTTELTNAQQSISGVNLEEEQVNLLYYQQMYQANAKVIQTASTLLDTVLGISR